MGCGVDLMVWPYLAQHSKSSLHIVHSCDCDFLKHYHSIHFLLYINTYTPLCIPSCSLFFCCCFVGIGLAADGYANDQNHLSMQHIHTRSTKNKKKKPKHRSPEYYRITISFYLCNGCSNLDGKGLKMMVRTRTVHTAGFDIKIQ
jgi:hypothetical protein